MLDLDFYDTNIHFMMAKPLSWSVLSDYPNERPVSVNPFFPFFAAILNIAPY